MHTSSMQKKEFLKKWIKGLQICCTSKNKMDVLERKKKIKLSADIAMASVKKPATSWSHALISEAKKNKKDAVLVRKLLGSESQMTLQKSTNSIIGVHKRVQCKKILKRSCYSTGKRLVKKRTKVLKRLIPGGENMNDKLLINEAIDYILSLKVQVDVMRSVVSAAEVLSDDKFLKLVD